MNRSIYSSSAWVTRTREVCFVHNPWLAIFISPAQVYLSLFHYEPNKGRIRLYLCWWLTFAGLKSEMINQEGPIHVVWQVFILLIAAAVNAWMTVNLTALSVLAGGKLLNVALDFDKLKVITLWSVLPPLIATLVAEVVLREYPLLWVPVLLAGALYSFVIFFSGMKLFCEQTYKAILAPLIFPLLITAIALVAD